ncbi:MAG: FtsQ-type POTRA domain-containing protein [Pseudomonadota bacterium]
MKRTANQQILIRSKASRGNRYSGSRFNLNLGGGFGALFRGLWRGLRLLFSGVFLFILLGGISLALILGYQWAVNSPYFMVRKVVLSGLTRVDRDQVLAAAGLDKPVNTLSLRLNQMAAKLQDLPWVQEVNVSRKLPDAIVIKVKERRPETLISLGALYYLDKDGRPFKKVDPSEKPELPIITGFDREDFIKPADSVRRDLGEIFSLLDALADRNDRFRLENISEVNFDPDRGLTLFTREESVQLKIGWGDYTAKMKRLGRVLAYLKIKGDYDGLSYLNLECSPRVIVRRRV